MIKREGTAFVESELFQRFQDKDACEQMMNMLSLISNQTRFRILCLLTSGEFCVNDIVRIVGGKSSNISQQLKILMLAGYVPKERTGKQIYYRFEDRKVRKLIDFLHTLAGK